jgi:histone H3/H4
LTPAQPVRPERTGSASATGTGSPSFKPSLVKAVFRDVTPLHVSRSAALAAASVTRTVLTGIIDGALRAAEEEARKKLLPRDLVQAIDRDVELEVGGLWYHHSPTFTGLTGAVDPPRRSRSRKPSAVVGAHRFEAGVRKLLRERGAAAVPAMVRDLDGIASVFLTDLARASAMVVREGGLKRFGTVALVTPGEQVDTPPAVPESVRTLSTRTGDRRTIGRDDVLAATMIQLFGGVRQRALAAAREATATGSDG